MAKTSSTDHPTLKVSNYENAHLFLKDSWEQKRRKNPQFSMRAWAKQLGLQNHAPLYLMMSGKRAIAKRYVPAFIESLGLSAKEGLYFETLIEFNQARSSAEKRLYLKRLENLRPKDALQIVELESFRYFENPLHCIVYDMTDLRDFRADPKWIQSRLRLKTSIREIEEVLSRLKKLKLLREVPERGLAKTQNHVTNAADVLNLASQEYHRRASAYAAEQIGLQTLLEREFNSFSFCVKRADLPRAKTRLRELVRNFIREWETPATEGEETYQLNCHLFALTKTSNEGEVPHEKNAESEN